jgi:uncharacterized membrane-anchored protein
MKSNSSKSLPLWRFFLPLGLQILLILAVPAQAIYIHLAGRTVILQTVPVDPYDLLRGYSQTLRYNISNIDTLKQLSDRDGLLQEKEDDSLTPIPAKTTIYVILESPNSAASEGKPPLPWTPVAISSKLPTNLPANQIVLRGEKSRYSPWVDYGLETYYIPEDQRDRINQEIAQLQQQSEKERTFLVEVKVDRRGNAVPVSLWLGDRYYRF